jgi:transcriptional regulator with XRE-family HTH domain
MLMNFPTFLFKVRKSRGFTQQELAESATVHVNQVRRYEAGSAQPTLEALTRLAQTLHVSLDELVFGDNERGPSDDLRLQFEAVSQMPDEDRHIVRALLDGMILRHRARQIISG